MRILRQRPTYTSCDDLPLANFIKIVCTGELVHLYSEPARFIHRNAPLADIWEHIFNEYNELTNNTQSKHVFNLIKEITVLGNRIGIVNDCVNLLRSVEDIANYPDCIAILNSYGCSHITITNENRRTSLDRCITVCKRYIADNLLVYCFQVELLVLLNSLKCLYELCFCYSLSPSLVELWGRLNCKHYTVATIVLGKISYPTTSLPDNALTVEPFNTTSAPAE